MPHEPVPHEPVPPEQVPQARDDIEVRPYPTVMRIGSQVMRAGRRIEPMHALVDVDVTLARWRLAQAHPPLSLTALVIACVARAVAAHPEVHAYRDWRGRLVQHRDVDVGTIVEVPGRHGPFGMAHLLRDAHRRSVADITAELRRVKADPAATPVGGLVNRAPVRLMGVPGVVPLLWRAAAHSTRVRQRVTGTVAVSAVSMFGGGAGFGIGVPTIYSLAVFVGGRSVRPRVVDGQVEVRDVLDLTVTFDHRVVEGAAAARFIAQLRGLLESPDDPSLWDGPAATQAVATP